MGFRPTVVTVVCGFYLSHKLRELDDVIFRGAAPTAAAPLVPSLMNQPSQLVIQLITCFIYEDWHVSYLQPRYKIPHNQAWLGACRL
jgi:hypothetical protein